jgi:hypothetical protein
LRSSDPMERLTAIHLAAAAPEMRYMLERLTHRLSVALNFTWAWRKDTAIVQEGYETIIASKPPHEEVYRILREREAGQIELDFEESA